MSTAFTHMFKYDITKIDNIYGTQILYDATMNISGSTVLNLVNRSVGNEDNLMPNDLDIYVDIRKCKDNSACLNNLLYHLFYNNYRPTNYIPKNSGDSDLSQYKQIWKCIQSICENNLDDNNDVNEGYKSNHIKRVFKYYNPRKNDIIDKHLHIDVILIDCDIETLISDLFDFDAISNYMTYTGDIYVKNIESIKTHTCGISLEKFGSIMKNNYLFEKFIERYTKYKIRGYNFKLYCKDYDVDIVCIDDVFRIIARHLYGYKKYTAFTSRRYIYNVLSGNTISMIELNDVWEISHMGDVIVGYVATTKKRADLMSEIRKYRNTKNVDEQVNIS